MRSQIRILPVLAWLMALFGLFASAQAIATAPSRPGMWLTSAVEKDDGPSGRADQAVGAVIWLHGLSLDKEDSESSTPPYIKELAQRNWHTFRLNRLKNVESLDATSAFLVEAAAYLRAQGYKRVTVAGQSFGAFAALKAIDRDNDGVKVIDAVVATAPAAYGSIHHSYKGWLANATVLYDLLRQVGKTQLMLFYFNGDDYDPGGRGKTSREILSKQASSEFGHHIVIDRPADLVGHSAAASGLFTRRYVDCIERFLSGVMQPHDDAFHCESPWGQNPSAELLTQLQLPTVESASGANTLEGLWYGFYSNGREVLLQILNVQGNNVRATYTLGPRPGYESQFQTSPREGILSGDTLRFDEPGHNRLHFKVNANGSLSGEWLAIDGNGKLDMMLRRLRRAGAKN